MTSHVHTDPMLYTTSPVLVDTFQWNERRVPYFIYEEERGQSVHRWIQSLGITPSHLLELQHPLESEVEKTIQAFISDARMGSQLYIEATWDVADQAMNVAIQQGFTEDEIQIKIIGPKKKFLYCMKCFSRQEIDVQAKEVCCPGCGAMSEVGPFFSRVRKGYIGYLFDPSVSPDRR